MKKILSNMYALLTILILVTACNEEHEDLRPGLYTSKELIETFPGDTVLVSGTVSNYIGISSITLKCEAWKIEKTYDLSVHKPTVFNYNYQMIVPKTATFDQNMEITVSDKNGLENKRTIPLKFLPDTESPAVVQAPAAQTGLDFDTSTGKAVWNLNMKFTDDRALKSVRLQITGLNMDEVIPMNGREDALTRLIEFTSQGSYPVTITVTDESANELVLQTEILVMLAEEEDPIQDYPQMYVVDATENPDDYINGYYRYMDHKGEYQYEGKFYAATDNAKIYFVPAKSMDGDLYGVSPYVSSRLMNKNGYVVPVTLPAKGYYGIYIDLNLHSYSIWNLEIPADVCTDPLWMSGTGFDFTDWGASDEMIKTDSYHYEVETQIKGDYADDRQYYFYSSGWARVFRSDAAGNWWFESASGSAVIFKTDYNGKVKVTFDTAAPWGTIKRVIE